MSILSFRLKAHDEMGEYEQEERRSGTDRREGRESTWRDGKVWAALFAVLISILIALLTVAVNKLSNIEQSVQSTRDMVLISNTEQKMLRRDVDELDNRVTTIEKAYQYNLNQRLTYLEAKTGIKQQQQPKPEE